MRCVAIVASALRELRLVEAEGLEQQRPGDGEAFDRGFAGNHGSVLGSVSGIAGAGSLSQIFTARVRVGGRFRSVPL